jgi:hypothetical protein
MLSLIPACLSASLVDCFGDFFYFSLPIGLLWLTALALSLISACFLASLVDCFGDFFYFGLPIWAISVDCFGASADSSLLFGFFG